jgi:hypothetical protein
MKSREKTFLTVLCGKCKSCKGKVKLHFIKSDVIMQNYATIIYRNMKRDCFKFGYCNQKFQQVRNILVQPKNEVCVPSIITFSVDLATYIPHEVATPDITCLAFAHCKISCPLSGTNLVLTITCDKSKSIGNLYFCNVLSNKYKCRCRFLIEPMTINVIVA